MRPGKKLVEVNPDGNCLYRAVAQAFYAERTHKTLTQHEEVLAAQSLRRKVARYIRQHPQVVAGEEEYLVHMGNRPHTTRSIEEFALVYANRVESWHLKRWGGPLELAILSHLLQCKIDIYDSTGTRFASTSVTINSRNSPRLPRIAVAYRQYDHYNAMVPSATLVVEPYGHPRASTPNIADHRTLRRSGSSGKSSQLSSFNSHLKTGYIQSLRRLGANKAILEWAQQSPLAHVAEYHGEHRNKLIAARKNPSLRHDDACKHAQHQAFVYTLHHATVPPFLNKEIKRTCVHS